MRWLLIPLLFAVGVFEAQAALTINSVTLNGAASVTVAPSASVTATINETNSLGSGAQNWRSTRFTTSPASTTQCVNHADRNGAGTYSLSVTITVPAAEGVYDAIFLASSNDSCGGSTSAVFTLPGGIVVNSPPSVTSISRASPDPTTAGATVSWTVTFSEAVTGVDAGDFSLIQAGLSGSVITGVTGSGVTRTVTATVGSGDGTLGLNLVDNDTIQDVLNHSLGGTGAGNGDFSGEIYTISFTCSPPAGSPAGLTCVCDTFDRATLNPSPIFSSNWVLSSSDATGILPSIVSNRLRLTNNTGNNAKSATVSAIFPAAGNYFSIDFRLYAYAGSGADGVAVTLSDYAVPAVAGAYGGSLGYAQRCGVNGFAGGWLGIGIDEYGNFRNDEECRGDGGSPTGRTLDSVAVRGSGAGLTGYLHHAESGGLAPGVDQPGGTPGPGHRYRIIVDHSNDVNAWTTVQRDVGSGYVTIIPQYDAKGMPGQAAVPSNWKISFTGSTGGATNFHEIDDMRICATYVWPPNGGTASGFSAIDEAYGNASGSPKPATQSYLTGNIYTKLMGQPFKLNVAALTSANQIQTAYVVSGSKYLQIKLVDNSDNGCVLDSSQANYCSASCIAKSAVTGGSQVLTYAPANAGQKRTSDFMLYSAWKNLAVVMRECTTAACSAFTTTPAACGTDAFSVRPAAVNSLVSIETPPGAGNAATNGATSGNPKFRANADSFALTATVAGVTGNPNGYTGVLKVDGAGLQLVSPATDLGTVTGTFPVATSGTPSATATSTVFTYSEVGAFLFRGYDPASDPTSNRGVFDGVMSATECASLSAAQCDALRMATWTGLDSVSSKNDCIANSFRNTLDLSGSFATNANYGKYGCNFGLTTDSAAIGRFYPDHFDTEIPEHACSGAFTYSGQPFKHRVTARNAGGQVTKNYAGALAKLGTYIDGNGASGAFSPATLPAATYILGVADLTATPQLSFAYTNKLSAPSVLKLRITDEDGVSSATGIEGETPLRSGRLLISNAHGSELLGLTMPVQTQYWTGAAWQVNALDYCTDVGSSLVFVKNPAGLPSPGGGAISAGVGALVFAVPNQRGSVDVCANLGADVNHPMTGCRTGGGSSWLQGSWDADGQYNDNPAARATFGIYEQKSPVIYRREQY